MYSNVRNEVKNVLEIVEQVYVLRCAEAERRLENIKRINLDSLVSLIEKELSNAHINSTREMVDYIETIIED